MTIARSSPLGSARARALRQGQALPVAAGCTSGRAAALHAAHGTMPPAWARSQPARVLQSHNLLAYCQPAAHWACVPRPPLLLAKAAQAKAGQEPLIIPRKQWGAAQPVIGPGSSYDKIPGNLNVYYDTIVLHHSGNKINYPTVRQVQKEQMDDHYADIAYHYAVDKDGKIYEGRPINIKGAHVKGKNTGKIGVVLLADLDKANSGLSWPAAIAESFNGNGDKTEAMVESLVNLVQFLRRTYGIEVFGGHKEVLNDQNYNCPGDVGMGIVKQIRTTYKFRKP